MASVIILLEREPSDDPGIGPDVVDVALEVRWVHAAPADPDIPEDPGPRTLCGLDTDAMQHEPYRPTGPGQPWYPPLLHDRRCRECEAVLRSI
ncbi:hypothetical protein [Kitasatospora sp. NPDC050543]|uniref:hypothetical protein n=1 Tax=Kitasatospora sp. NPDC050543 TaxID=3364054 RepID=UPI0037B31956